MPSSQPKNATSPHDDGTRQLLQWGGSMVATGLVCVLLLITVFGGYSRNGASTNAGWFALIVALMCLPFGGLLLALGVAKWVRNYREQDRR
jgi:high-affinity K+ transport system ATPase subunit B